MVICDLHIAGIARSKIKADPKLIIDPNAVLSFSVAVKFLKTICWWDLQILQRLCIVKHDQFPQSDPLNIMWKFL